MAITLDRDKKLLGFCTESRAKILMEKGHACIYRYYPFTIIVKEIDVRDTEFAGTYRLRIDPVPKTTGMAVVCNKTSEVMLHVQIGHRGDAVKENPDPRQGQRVTAGQNGQQDPEGNARQSEAGGKVRRTPHRSCHDQKQAVVRHPLHRWKPCHDKTGLLPDPSKGQRIPVQVGKVTQCVP